MSTHGWVSISEIKMQYPTKRSISKIPALDDIMHRCGATLWAITGTQSERIAYEIMHSHGKVHILQDINDFPEDGVLNLIDVRNICDGNRFQSPDDSDGPDDIDHDHRYRFQREIARLKYYVLNEGYDVLIVCRDTDFHPTISEILHGYCDVILRACDAKITTIKNRNYIDWLTIEFP